jgi:hypothetical protein
LSHQALLAEIQQRLWQGEQGVIGNGENPGKRDEYRN